MSRLPPSRGEGRGRGRRCRRGQRGERLQHGVGIVGLDGCRGTIAVAEGREDGLGQRQRLAQAGGIVTRLGAQQQAHVRGAVGEGGGDRLEADLGDLVDGERQHVGWQAVAIAGGGVDQLARRARRRAAAAPASVAAGRAIGGEQRADRADELVGRRKGIAHRAGRAGGAARAAAAADVGIDRDVIVRRRDRAGRAQVEAARAAGDARARMRAQVLLEGRRSAACRTCRRGRCALRIRRSTAIGVGGIGAQIAVAQVGRGEQRRAAGEVDDDVGARGEAVALGAEFAVRRARRRPARRSRRWSARMRRDGRWPGARRPLRTGNCGGARRRDLGLAGQQHGDVEGVGERARRPRCAVSSRPRTSVTPWLSMVTNCCGLRACGRRAPAGPRSSASRPWPRSDQPAVSRMLTKASAAPRPSVLRDLAEQRLLLRAGDGQPAAAVRLLRNRSSSVRQRCAAPVDAPGPCRRAAGRRCRAASCPRTSTRWPSGRRWPPACRLGLARACPSNARPFVARVMDLRRIVAFI